MGKHPSTFAKGSQSGRVETPSKNSIYDSEVGMESSHRIDKIRWADLMYSLQSVATLQRAATRARIEARQKRREATFKREDVWIGDAKFIREIQKLDAQGKLQGFEELSRLAAECQVARDVLGPLEQESIEAESRWQGKIWKLKEVEEDLYAEFEDEFKEAAKFVSSRGEGTQTQSSSSESDNEDSIVLKARNRNEEAEDANWPPDSGLAEPERPYTLEPTDWERQPFGDVLMSDLDSGFGDIDTMIGMPPPPLKKYGLPKALPRHRNSGIEFYHELVEDFSTRRERVNKWLENNALQCRLEGLSIYSILQDLLGLESQKVPSNWANLVVAYWEHDEASMPASSKFKHQDRSDVYFYGNTKHNEEPALTSQVLSKTNLRRQTGISKSDGNTSTTFIKDPELASVPRLSPSSPASLFQTHSDSRTTREETEPP